LHIFNLIQ